jgi:hypothetical protein
MAAIEKAEWQSAKEDGLKLFDMFRGPICEVSTSGLWQKRSAVLHRGRLFSAVSLDHGHKLQTDDSHFSQLFWFFTFYQVFCLSFYAIFQT